jgi:large subunit ribosomal protein L21
MFNYAVCEISGKQYKVVPGVQFNVALQEETKEISAKVLMLVEGDKVQVGSPYLTQELKLKVLENGMDKKIRVAKFHAKANYRRVRGYRSKITKVVYSA